MIELPPASFSAPDRPPVICEACTRARGACRCVSPIWLYLHIHDAEYMRERAAWRRKLAATHPDAGGAAWRFREVSKARRAWIAREVIFYARLGLTPPDGAQAQVAGIAQNIRARAERRQLVNPNPDTEKR